jgi:hypothetical protein
MEENVSEENFKYGCGWLKNASQSKLKSGTAEMNRRKEAQEKLGNEIHELLDRYECDAIMVPTSTNIPYDLEEIPQYLYPWPSTPRTERLPERSSERSQKDRIFRDLC